MNWDSFFVGFIVGVWFSVGIRDLGEYMRRQK